MKNWRKGIRRNRKQKSQYMNQKMSKKSQKKCGVPKKGLSMFPFAFGLEDPPKDNLGA